MQMNEPAKAVSVIYTEHPGKPTIPATGAYGGLTGDGGSVVLHLYTEYSSVPAAVRLELAEGKAPNETSIAVKSDGVREIQATIVMSPEAAQSIGRFLIDKAKIAFEVRPK